MDADIQAFLRYIQTERRLSAHSLRAYTLDLENYYDWCTVADTSTRMATREHVREYVMDLHDKLAPASVARRLSALKSFYKFLIRCNRLDASPADGLRGPKQPKLLPKMLSVDEMIALLSPPLTGDEGDPLLQLRDLAILEMLYGAGQEPTRGPLRAGHRAHRRGWPWRGG